MAENSVKMVFLPPVGPAVFVAGLQCTPCGSLRGVTRMPAVTWFSGWT